MNITPNKIKEVKPDEIFVFGSNLAGRHGKGAAKNAIKWGAIYGEGVGHFGQTYGIPTKNEKLEVLPINEIKPYIVDFIEYVKENKKLIFLVTEIGCGLSGYTPKEIAPLFKECKYLPNVFLPKSFREELIDIFDF